MPNESNNMHNGGSHHHRHGYSRTALSIEARLSWDTSLAGMARSSTNPYPRHNQTMLNANKKPCTMTLKTISLEAEAAEVAATQTARLETNKNGPTHDIPRAGLRLGNSESNSSSTDAAPVIAASQMLILLLWENIPTAITKTQPIKTLNRIIFLALLEWLPSAPSGIFGRGLQIPSHRIHHIVISSVYLGVASGRPPSTGMVAPVVGVWCEAKKRTAFATCSAVTCAFRRLRLW